MAPTRKLTKRQVDNVLRIAAVGVVAILLAFLGRYNVSPETAQRATRIDEKTYGYRDVLRCLAH